MWVRSLGQEEPLEEEMGNSLQYSCLGNPTGSGAWWATVHGVIKSRTQLCGWARKHVTFTADWCSRLFLTWDQSLIPGIPRLTLVWIWFKKPNENQFPVILRAFLWVLCMEGALEGHFLPHFTVCSKEGIILYWLIWKLFLPLICLLFLRFISLLVSRHYLLTDFRSSEDLNVIYATWTIPCFPVWLDH